MKMNNEKIIAEVLKEEYGSDVVDESVIRIAKKIANEARASGMNAGVVVALDCIAGYDDVLFKEIVESSGEKEVLKEIMKNGLAKTKETAKSIFPKYKFDRCLNE